MGFKDHRLQTRLQLKPDVIEQVYAKLAHIDGVKNSFRITGKILPQTLERLTQSVLVTSTGSSNRIEGNRMSDDEVEKLYKKLRIQQFKSRDEQEIAGYIQCLESVFHHSDDMPIRESFILSLHDKMLTYSDKDQPHKGRYKVGSNRVEAKDPSGQIVGIIFDPTPPYLVAKEMGELVDWYNWAMSCQAKHTLIIIANFIFEYLAIHPFQDGNGRTSRLLTNLMLLQQGYLFTRVISHEKIIEAKKIDYYKALNQTQASWKKEEDISAWLVFFLDVLVNQSSQALHLMQEDQIEHFLSIKQLEFWRWIHASDLDEFSRKIACESLNFPQRTVESIIKKLLDMKRLEKLGQGRSIRYRLRRF